MKNFLEKMMGMVGTPMNGKDNIWYVQWFLKGCGVILDQEYYDKIDELKKKMFEVLYTDPESVPDFVKVNEETGEEEIIPKDKFNGIFSSNEKECKDNSDFIVSLYVVSAVESILGKYGAKDVTKKSSYVKRLIRVHRATVKLKLQEKLDETFKELYATVEKYEAAAKGQPSEDLYKGNNNGIDENIDVDSMLNELSNIVEEGASQANEESTSEEPITEETPTEEVHTEECSDDECPICKAHNYEPNEETKAVLQELEDHIDDPEWKKENIISFDTPEEAIDFLMKDSEEKSGEEEQEEVTEEPKEETPSESPSEENSEGEPSTDEAGEEEFKIDENMMKEFQSMFGGGGLFGQGFGGGTKYKKDPKLAAKKKKANKLARAQRKKNNKRKK